MNNKIWAAAVPPGADIQKNTSNIQSIANVINLSTQVNEHLTDDEAIVYEHVIKFPGKIVREIAYSLNMPQDRVKAALRGLRNKHRVIPGIVYAYYPYVSNAEADHASI